MQYKLTITDLIRVTVFSPAGDLLVGHLYRESYARMIDSTLRQTNNAVLIMSNEDGTLRQYVATNGNIIRIDLHNHIGAYQTNHARA